MNPQNPKTRWQGWLAILLIVPVLLAAMLLGFILFIAVLGLAALFAVVLAARLWWLKRKLRKTGNGMVLEGEYVVVREESPSDRQRRS
ncbi:MAG: hypothetical protein ABR558_08515 [Thioalkalivibrio sp.]